MSAPGQAMAVREFDLPDLEPGAVLLKTICSEVCGTDCHLHHGRLAGVPYPIIPGHVSVGEIAAMGGTVRDIDGVPFKEGQRVVFLDVHETCGACWYCLVAKATTRCPSRKVYGITYSADDGLLGGWSEFIYLKPGVKILRLPKGLTPEAYIAGGCGASTALHAIERSGVRLGDSVAIQGCGPVGLNALIFARLSGAGQIIVTGAPAERLALAGKYGADATVSIDEHPADERIEIVRRATGGRGADVTIEASGNPQAVAEGARMTRDGGVYVVVGQYTDNGPVEINPHLDINAKHLDVRGCWGIDFSHLYRTLRVMSRHAGDFDWPAMLSARYGLDETQRALEDVEQLRVVKALIDPWKEA